MSKEEERHIVDLINQAILAEVRDMPFFRWFDMSAAVDEASECVKLQLQAVLEQG